MAGTYGAAQKKYYEKNKDTIYRRTLKYKTEYNKKYYALQKERRKTQQNQALSEAMYNQTLDTPQKTQ